MTVRNGGQHRLWQEKGQAEMSREAPVTKDFQPRVVGGG